MELKWSCSRAQPLIVTCFNRTFMELKLLAKVEVFYFFPVVLIVPLWN